MVDPAVFGADGFDFPRAESRFFVLDDFAFPHVVPAAGPLWAEAGGVWCDGAAAGGVWNGGAAAGGVWLGGAAAGGQVP